MASGRYANTKKSLLLVTLMILMTQVGYLENLNPWISGEEALDSNDAVAQSSAGTSVMYGNNTQWAPQGPMSTSSIRAQDIIAVSDEVILFQHSGGSNGCLGAYNRYNETSWTPTFATPSGNACTSGTNTFEFLGMIGDITLFTFDEHSGQYRGDSIYAYNLANDTAYRVFQSPMLTYPTYSSFSARVVMVGNSVYMAEYHNTQPGEYKLGVFNFDNQSHWTYDSILPSNCSDQILNLVVFSETKLLLSCDASWANSYYVFNIENESMYPVNGLNGSTLNEALSGSDFALVGTKLLFDATTCFSCKSNPWVFDSTNDTAWVVQDVMADANTGFIMNNMMRSGTSVLFTGYGYNYSTSSALPTNLYWYESTNDTIWQATFFTDSALTMNNKHGELANGDIVFTTISGSNEATYFHNPANGSVWQEEALCYGTYGSDCGEFVLIEVYGNTIFGTAKMNRTGSLYGWDSMIAYDFSNKSTQVSWNLGNAPGPQSHMVYNQGFALGDQLLFPYRCAQSTSTTCARVNNGTSTSNDATMIWSPYAIRVNDAWNMSKGEIEGAYDPISGGVGTRYSPGVGVQNLTASVEGADLSIDVPMTNITFQYNASAINETGLTWLESDIDTNADGAESLFVADMDGDGDLDIVSASVFDDTIAWYENDGATEPSWTASDIDTNADYARSVFVADMDDDGDLDIVSASYLDDTIAWYENDGAANPSWSKNVVATSADGAMQVHVADMDDDGDLDIVSASYNDDTIAWYENDGSADPSWTASDIDTNADGAWRVYVADMDGDGDLDIVSQSNLDDTIAWYENDGAADPSWTASDIDTNINGGNGHWGGYIVAADMDGDSDLDLVSTQNGTTVWYENDGASDPSWTVATISTMGFASIHVTDMDNDGDLDIVAPFWGAIHYYENDGASDPSWTQGTNISSSSGSASVHVADMDGDSDLDVASAEFGTDTIAWYKSAPVTWTDITGASCSISPALPAGLSIDSSTCTISGTPTVETSNTTYTVTAVISGVTYQTSVWLSSSYLELTPSVEGADLYLDSPMTDITFHYNASTASTTAIGYVNGRITTLGNGSTWMVADLYSGTCISLSGSSPMLRMSYQIGDVHYFDACGGGDVELWAHNTSNGTLWAVTDINTAGHSYVGGNLDVLVGDTLFFNAYDGSDYHLWAHDTSNHSTWKVIESNSNSAVGAGQGADLLLIHGDVFYFAGNLGNGMELLAYNTSNDSVWEVADIASGSAGSYLESIHKWEHRTGPTLKGPILNDEVFFFYAGTSSSNRELWAYNISNSTAWEAYAINTQVYYSGNVQYIAHTEDVIYISGECTTNCNPTSVGNELWAYNATNQSGWLVADIATQTHTTWAHSHPGEYMPDGHEPLMIEDTFYFDAYVQGYGRELWAHNTSNGTTWQVANLRYSGTGDSNPGYYTNGFTHEGRLYFDADDGVKGRELWVYDPSNASTWRLTDINPNSGSSIRGFIGIFGDIFYFDADDGTHGRELWAYDPSNESSWLVEDINTVFNSGSTQPSIPAEGKLIGDTIYFRATDQSNDYELFAYQPAEITSSGSSGTCSISPSLPTGLSIDSSTCTISGTPTVETSNTTYTVTAVISNVTYQGSVWLSTSTFGTITSAVEGAALNLGEAMTPITLNYTADANASSSSSFAYVNKKIATGTAHACGILDNGNLKCWGDDNMGQLGDGGSYTDTNAPSSTPIDLGTGRTAVAVGGGYHFTCALLDDGDVKCWGYDEYGKLGDGGSNTNRLAPSSTPIDFGTGRTAVALSTGYRHACAILDNGELKCWGANYKGQLGDGTNNGRTAPQSTPIDLGSGRTAVAVAAGFEHTCAILDNGELKCWGSDGVGQLGDGGSNTNTNAPSSTPIDLGTGRTAVAVAIGQFHVCAILDNGDIKCWGGDGGGQLGNGLGNAVSAPSSTPIDLGAGRTAVALDAMASTTCAILDNGDMKCWGSDSDGQLGDGGSNTAQNSPVLVSGSNTWDTTTTDVVTWETHPALPAGMSISGGTISGTPSVYAKNQTYTIYANQSGYSTMHELYFSVDTDNAHTVVENQTIDPIGFHPPFNNGTTCWSVSPALPGNLSIDSSTGEITGSVNGTLTNTTYTVTANHGCTGSGTGGGSGNGTIWTPTPPSGSSTSPLMADYFMLEHDGVIYFDANSNNGKTVFAYSTVNQTMWIAIDMSHINSASSFDETGKRVAQFIGDDLFFSMKNSTSYKTELWVYSTSNGTTWQVMTQNQPSGNMEFVIGNRLYFDESYYDGSNFIPQIAVYDTSNHTYWNYSTTMLHGSSATCDAPGENFHALVGDTIYFDACDASQSYGNEMYAFNTVNGTYWRVADLDNGTDHSWPGKHMHIVIGDTIYFDAQVGNPSTVNAHALWAYNTSNGSTWLAADVNEPGRDMRDFSTGNSELVRREPVVIGDTMYFDARGAPSTARTSIGSTCTFSHQEIYAYNIGNQTAWCVADAGGLGWSTSANGDAGHNMLTLVGDILLFDAWFAQTPTSSARTNSLWAHNLSNGTTWEISSQANPSVLSEVGNGHSVFSVNNALYFPAQNNSGREVWGYDIVNQTYWLVNDTCPGWCSGMTGGNYHTLMYQGVFYSSVTISQNGIGDQYILGVFNPVPSSSTSSGGSGGGSGSGSGSGGSTGTGATETFTFNLQSLADYDGDGLPNDLPGDYDAAEGPTPGLVADTDDDADGLLDTVETNTGTYVDSSDTGTDPLNPDTDGDGICDGPLAVPGVCIAGPDTNYGATVVDTPIVLLNNSDVDEIAPFYPATGATYGLSPDLPTSMQFDASNGSIWGTPDMVMANTTYTMWANLSDGTSTSWTFFLEVLEDLDGDGMPDVLPGDYNATNDPIRTPGLEEDLDDDGDGYNDTAETDTGLYLDGNNTGTDPRDPDTDDDGICDGPNAVPGVCVAGPDLTPFGPPATVVAVNNTMIPSVPPYYAGSGLTYEVTPDLPAGLTIDPMNGYLMGIPTETTGNITYTVYANHSDGTSYSWDFTIEVLEDSDGDGSPDSLPADYDGDNDSIRAPPGLTEDLDDDNDGMSDEDEIANGTLPLNPDTDGDGFCDGINAVAGVCFAGPDPYPNDPNMPLDTDGDGLPDDDSAWTGPPYADEDDDNDGFPDVSEDACGSDSLDANSIPDDMDGDTICDGDDDDMDGDGIDNVNETGDTTVPPGSSPINPDTDGDGICDGPESPVTSNCTAGPDMFPLDPSAWEDTDGDGYPNELFPPSNSTPPLEEDLDDDNDGWSDIDEVNCGSDPVNASDMPVDLNGDGICDVLDLDWDDDGIPNANETDTGIYVDASDTGTDPWNPDTDGDGFCDGPFAVFNETDTVCIAGPDPFPHDPNMPMDTDGDGLPNELPEDYIGNLVEDTDDDNDGYSDVSELNCASDPLDATSTPTNDLDGDGLCDAEDPDVDGDGLSNETELAEGSLTSYMNADTDGDGVCDGPSAPALPAGICVAGPDAFPDDPAAWLDTDGDGDPDELVDDITTDLVLDLDDDNDGWEDVDELACGTNTKDDMSTPFDGDDDGICDVLDTQTLGYTINGNESEMFEAYVNQSDFVLMPNLTGMEPGLWTIEPALPAGLSFSGTARSGETGIISGIPTEASPMTNYTVTADNGRVNISFTFGLGVLEDTDGDRLPDEPSLTGLETDLDDDNDGHLDEIEIKCGSDPLNQSSVPNVDEDGNCIEGKYADDDSDDDNGFLMCLMPLCLIFLLALLLLALLFRDKVVLMGPEPENTTSDPAFLSGAGTKDDPFVLKPVKALKAGTTVEAKETISIVNMSPEIRVNLLDLAESTNDKRFRMYEVDGTSEEPGFNLDADEEGRLRLRFVFDDSDEPTYPGGTYEGLLKLGKASVYLSWTVDVKEDKRMMNKIRKEQEAAEKAEKEAKEAEEKAKAEAEAKEAEEKAKAEAEAKAAEEKAAKEAEKKAKAEEKAAAAALAKKEKEEAAAKKKEEAAAKKAKAAEEKAAKEAEEAEAKSKAEAEAKAAEEKAAKEAEKKAKAEEKAAAAAAAKKAKEEEEAKKKAEAEAKAAKEAEEKAKAEDAAKKKAEKKPATTKEAKKQEELQRVKQRAKTIDFKVLGEAESSELKSEVKKGATTLEVANAKDFAESGSAEINDAKGSTIIAWTGKDGNTLTGVSGVTRVFAAKAVLMVKDDLQVIKGIGPFIEEKLNALGITTYRQLANMTAKLETQVNEAIEFFPGRVKRDQWVNQAKILLGMDVKLDEKALKQAEELERIAQKAEGIDFGVLGVASASEADDLQKIKGIGPFIAEKLNALGIYKFSQLANMTSEIEEEVNVAIEFFPGRVKRDEWAKQAKEFAKD